MSFQPILAASGYLGWRFLESTLESQEAAFAQAPANVRETDYFAENIGSITSAADLVADRRLLSVALGAFGLDEDINSGAFIQRILSDGTSDDDALANRLADSRYREFSAAFGFGEASAPRTVLSGFADEIIDQYERAQFEIAVGEQDADMRLALNTAASVSNIATSATSQDGKWFSVMGNPPLRKVFETALGLPDTFAQVDIDTQLETFKERAEAVFGSDSVDQFTDQTKQEELIRQFLVRSEIANFQAATSGSIALTLLQGL